MVSYRNLPDTSVIAGAWTRWPQQFTCCPRRSGNNERMIQKDRDHDGAAAVATAAVLLLGLTCQGYGNTKPKSFQSDDPWRGLRC